MNKDGRCSCTEPELSDREIGMNIGDKTVDWFCVRCKGLAKTEPLGVTPNSVKVWAASILASLPDDATLGEER